MASVVTRRSARTATRRTTDFGLDYPESADDNFVLPPADPGLLPSENLEERVQTTQQRLSQLRAEADMLEREKHQFEELSRKQKEFMSGRGEIADKLNRAIAGLDRDTYEAHKRAEQFQFIRDTFQHHIERIESLTPEEWNPVQLESELTRAISVIDEARGEYEKGIAHMQMILPHPVTAPAPVPAAPSRMEAPLSSAAMPPGPLNSETFRYWAFCGLAFTLPLAVIGLLGLIIHAIVR
jgi:hypothetical protein